MVAPATKTDSPASLFTPEEREGLRLWMWTSLALPLLAPPFDRSGKPASGLFVLAPLTGERDRLLELSRSPLCTGEPFNRFTLLQALWICSPGFRVGAWWGFMAWAFNRIFLPFERTAAALRRWHLAQFIDRPPRLVGSRSAPVNHTYGFACYVLTCKHRLELGEAELLAAPVGRCLQQLAALESGRGGDVPAFDPERDRRVGDYLRAKQAAREAATLN
jgi:hypothetical protein